MLMLLLLSKCDHITGPSPGGSVGAAELAASMTLKWDQVGAGDAYAYKGH